MSRTLAALLIAAVPAVAQDDGGPTSRPAAEGVRLAQPVRGLAWLRDGRLSVNDADGLRVVDPRTGEVLALPGEYPGPPAAALAADALAVLDAAGDIVVWDPVDLIPIEVLPLSGVEGFAAVSPADVRLTVSSDGGRVTATPPSGLAAAFAVEEPGEVERPAPVPEPEALVRALRADRGRIVVTMPPAAGGRLELDVEDGAPGAVALDARGARLAWTIGARVVFRRLRPAADGGESVELFGGETRHTPSGLSFDDRGRLLVLRRGADQSGWWLDVMDPESGARLARVELGAGPAPALAAAANAPRFLVARVGERVDVYDAWTLEVSATIPLAATRNPLALVFARDPFAVSPDGALMAMPGGDGLVLVGATSPGSFRPSSLRLPPEAGRPYAMRFGASGAELHVGCLGASPEDPAREWRCAVEEGEFTAGWTPSVPDPDHHPYAWSADGATRAEVFPVVEWRVERAGEGGWSRLVGPRAVTNVAESQAAGAAAVVLEGDSRVRFVDLATGADLEPGEDG